MIFWFRIKERPTVDVGSLTYQSFMGLFLHCSKFIFLALYCEKSLLAVDPLSDSSEMAIHTETNRTEHLRACSSQFVFDK